MESPKGKIVFRADGSKVIGFGQLVRSVALAQQFKKLGYDVLFLVTVIDKNVANFFDYRNIKFMGYAPPSLEKMVYNHLNVMEMFGAETTILDSKMITKTYRQGLKKGGAKIVAIDDKYRYCSDADAVINYNLNADASRYDQCGENLLTGPDYALVEKRFAEVKWNCDIEEPNILIGMGGSDAQDQTDRVLRALDALDENFRITLLRGLYVEGPKPAGLRHKCEVFEGVCDVPEVVSDCDAAITAGGLTTMNLAAAGAPFLVLLTSARQQESSLAWEKAGVGIHGGVATEMSEQEISEAIKKFFAIKKNWREMGLKGRKIIDGNGAERAAIALDSMRVL